MPRLVESLSRLQARTRSQPAFAKTDTRTFTLPEQIAESVAEAIIAGTFPPGSWIAEQDLADQFSVSRGPIREALRILEKEALVQIVPRRGTMVTKLTCREVENIFSIRAALMGLAGRQTAEQLSEDVETELAESVPKLERLARGEEPQEFLRLAYRVSMLLARTSNNARLYELILSMARQTLALTRMALDNRDNRKTWASNWKAIVSAIQKEDPEAAEKAAHRLVIAMGRQAAEYAGEEPPLLARRNGRMNGKQRKGDEASFI